MYERLRNRIQRIIGKKAECPHCGRSSRRYEFTPTGKTRRTDPDLPWLTPTREEAEVRCPHCSVRCWLGPSGVAR